MSAQPGKALQRKTERRQRRYPRFRVEFPVSLSIFSGGEPETREAHCRDLSKAGIGVLLAAEISLGEVAVLSLTLPGLPEVWKVRAVLRYRRGYHYGFEFLSLSEQQNRELAEYLPNLERADHDSGAALRTELEPSGVNT
jgi:c-di-GMP-binding flagellar brake protein YcgR